MQNSHSASSTSAATPSPTLPSTLSVPSTGAFACITNSLCLPDTHKLIALIEHISRTIKPNFHLYKPNDIGWLTQLFESIHVSSPSGHATFAQSFPLMQIDSYLTSNSMRLPGLRQTTDASGLPSWQLLHFSDRTITTEERRDYLQHLLVPQIAKSIIGILAELTPVAAADLRPDTLRALPPLADILIALDRQNEDESLTFLQRLNPSINLFDDICRDVITKRIQDAIRKVAS